MENKKLTVGTKVMMNGYQGRIAKVCDGQLTGMYEVRLERGTACVEASEFTVIDGEFPELKVKITTLGVSVNGKCFPCYMYTDRKGWRGDLLFRQKL